MEPIQDDIEMSAEESDAIWREVAAEVCKAVGVLALTLVPARFTELVAERDQLIQENTELREQVERYRETLEQILRPPLVLSSDDATDVAAWYTNVALAALSPIQSVMTQQTAVTEPRPQL